MNKYPIMSHENTVVLIWNATDQPQQSNVEAVPIITTTDTNVTAKAESDGGDATNTIRVDCKWSHCYTYPRLNAEKGLNTAQGCSVSIVPVYPLCKCIQLQISGSVTFIAMYIVLIYMNNWKEPS